MPHSRTFTTLQFSEEWQSSQNLPEPVHSKGRPTFKGSLRPTGGDGHMQHMPSSAIN